MSDKNKKIQQRRTMTRRDFIKRTAGAAAMASLTGLFTGCADSNGTNYNGDVIYAGTGDTVQFDPNLIRETKSEFPLGVSSGEPAPNAAFLWGYTESEQPRRLRVWRSLPGLNKVLLVVDLDVSPAEGGYLRVLVENLEPFTEYRFVWLEERNGSFRGRSLVGRFKTAPVPGQSPPVRVAATVCTDVVNGEFTVLERMAQEDFDMVVHLGDMSYNDGAATVDEFRDKWRETLLTEGYRQLLSQASMIISWDDHEVDNNWDPETTPDSKRESAFQAFYETLPVIRNAEDRLWRSFRWGDTAEFFVLDCRSERLPSTRETDDPIYISEEQMNWLKDGLLNSPCHFKVLLNSVPMTRMSALWDLAIDDRWSGYQKQRDEITGHIETNGIRNVWFLSGDFHVGFVARLEPGSGTLINETWEIACGPGKNYNPITLIANPTNQAQYDFIYPPGQFIFGDGANNETYLTFNPADDSVRIEFVNEYSGQKTFDQVLRQNWP